MVKGIVVLLIISAVILIALNSISILAINSSKDKSIDLNLKEVSDDEDSFDEIEKEIPITGTALERASATALEYIGEGRVTDSEMGDEDGYYEIEITLDNNNQVDVHLDKNFNVISTEWENEDDD